MTLALESLYGRIGDLDSHESISTPHYPEIFGEIGRRLVEDYPAMWRRLEQAGMDNGEPPESRITLDIPDNKPITQEAVWTLKGASAPGAVKSLSNVTPISRAKVTPLRVSGNRPRRGPRAQRRPLV